MVIHKRKVHLRKETFPSFTGTEEAETHLVQRRTGTMTETHVVQSRVGAMARLRLRSGVH